jgi:hypothetical protein
LDCADGGDHGLWVSARAADFDAEEQVVYAALLAERYPASLYVLHTETGIHFSPTAGATLDSVLANMITWHPAQSSEATASFAARNAMAYPVATDLNIGAPYVLVSDEEIAQLRATLGPRSPDNALWVQSPEFVALYPGTQGFMQLSRVGFNSSLDQALVYDGYEDSPWVEGDGSIYVLQRCTGGWFVTFIWRVWGPMPA